MEPVNVWDQSTIPLAVFGTTRQDAEGFRSANRVNSLISLPSDVLAYIFSRSSNADLLAISLTCRRFRDITKNKPVLTARFKAMGDNVVQRDLSTIYHVHKWLQAKTRDRVIPPFTDPMANLCAFSLAVLPPVLLILPPLFLEPHSADDLTELMYRFAQQLENQTRIPPGTTLDAFRSQLAAASITCADGRASCNRFPDSYSVRYITASLSPLWAGLLGGAMILISLPFRQVVARLEEEDHLEAWALERRCERLKHYPITPEVTQRLDTYIRDVQIWTDRRLPNKLQVKVCFLWALHIGLQIGNAVGCYFLAKSAQDPQRLYAPVLEERWVPVPADCIEPVRHLAIRTTNDTCDGYLYPPDFAPFARENSRAESKPNAVAGRIYILLIPLLFNLVLFLPYIIRTVRNSIRGHKQRRDLPERPELGDASYDMQD